MLNSLVESRIQVRSNCIIAYGKYVGTRSRSLLLFRKANMTIQKKKAYSGQVTQGMQKRITRAVNLLILSAKDRWILNEVTGREQKHKLSFITLTISENTKNIDAKEAYELLLKPFLQWMTKTKGVKTYIWKAELQKRGQVHYHITTHSFLNWKEIRSKWNYLQRKNDLLNDFHARFGHYDPNSTDVHEVYKKSDITGYLVKYIAKAESQKDKTTGKLWDCSENLKGQKYPDYEINNEQIRYMEQIHSAGYMQSTYRDNCAIHKIPEFPGTELLCQTYQDDCKKYLDALINRNLPAVDKAEKVTQLLATSGVQKPPNLVVGHVFPMAVSPPPAHRSRSVHLQYISCPLPGCTVLKVAGAGAPVSLSLFSDE